MRHTQQWTAVLALLLVTHSLTAHAAWQWQACPIQTRTQTVSSSSSSTPHALMDVLRKTRSVPQPQQPEPTKRRTRDVFSSLTAMCGSVPVPLDWSNQDNTSTITIFAKCYTSKTSTGQLWMLQGGPGASSWELETIMANVYSLTSGKFDICTTDFRGVDRSSLLNCIATEAVTVGSPGGCNIVYPEQQPCSAELQVRQHPELYSTSQAANDLYYLISNYPKTLSNNIIYAASYGTLWLSRFVQLFPDGADAYIFDGVVNSFPTNQFDFSSWDSHYNTVIQNMLKNCSADSFCSSKLTSNAMSFAQATFQKVFTSGGSCPAVTSASQGGLIPDLYTFNNLLYTLSTSFTSRPLIPAAIYRLNRCTSNDAVILNWLMVFLVNPTDPVNYCDTTSNDVIYNQVVSAELFNASLSAAEVIAISTAPTFSPQAGVQLYYTRQNWTTVVDKSAFGGFSTQKPILILNGDYDTQTPIDYAQMGTALGYGHIVSIASGSDYSPCGYSIVANFALEPTSTVSTACLSSLLTFDWQGNSSYNQFYVNTTDIYDGTASYGALSATPFIIALVVVSVIAGGLLVAVVIMTVQMFISSGAQDKRTSNIPLTNRPTHDHASTDRPPSYA